MRPKTFLLLATMSLALLATAAAAMGARGPAADGTLSVRDGRATIALRMKGGVIGRFARGKLTVTDSLMDGGTVVVRGAERQVSISEKTTVYSGSNIRFRIMDDRKFVVRIHASKINVSAVGRGDGNLDGWGDPEDGVFFDGTFSLNDEAYRSIPDDRVHFDLASPSAG